MKRPSFVRAIILAGSLLLQLSTLCFHSCGAAGDVDLSFDPGSGVNGPVHAVALQTDGKIIIGGSFTTVKGLARVNLARLNADGSGDSSFTAGAYGVPNALALQPDGKVLVGDFYYGISRLNSDGSLDTSFNAMPTLADGVMSIAVQPDGKVVIGGYFTTVGDTSRNRITRLNANGSLDSGFNPGTGANGFVRSIALQSDGKVLIGGNFSRVDGADLNGLARLNANGSLDASFNPGTQFNAMVTAIAIQPDGKVLVASNQGFIRLKTNGSLDSSFFCPVGANSIAFQSDGKILIGGYFSEVHGTFQNAIARVNANGSLDGTFNPGLGATAHVTSVVLQSDGKVLISGSFGWVNGTDRSGIGRLNADGSLDGTFNPGGGLASPVSSLVVQSDGKVLVGGVRLNADGSLDSSYTYVPNTNFNPNTGVPGTDYSVAESSALQSDGKVLIGGYTYTEVPDQGGGYFPVYSYFLYRFHPDGSRDLSFEPVLGNQSYYDFQTVRVLAMQPDGKVLMGGTFGIARRNANGTLDGSFIPGTGGSVSSVALQADGKVLIGGAFIYNGTNYSYGIARLNANGSLDSTFNPGTGANGHVSSVIVQSDGKVLIGGSFTTVNGTNRNRIARLNANGSLDTTFNPGTGANGIVRAIALQSDGKVLIGGDFTTVNGVVRPYVARLYGDSIVVPSLNIARSSAFVIVSWPVTGLSFQLQETTNLSLPNSWSPVAQAAVTNAGQISVTVPRTIGPKFFRLKSQ